MTYAIKFMKFILFSLNLLFVLIGLAMVIAGVLADFNINSFIQAIEFVLDTDFTGTEVYKNTQLPQAMAYVTIGLGFFVFLVAFFGCCGVVNDSYCLLITYAVVVSLLFLVKVIAVLVILLLGSKIMPIVVEKMQECFSQNYRGYLGIANHEGPKIYSQAMDTLMLKFECCGIMGPDDFTRVETSKKWHTEGRVYVDYQEREIVGDAVLLPLACCQFRTTNFPMNSTFARLRWSLKNDKCPLNPITSYHSMGCVEKITSSLNEYTIVIAITPVIIAVIEVVGVILASALAHELKQDIERSYY